ncbi:MAG: MFS transporter [Dysgonamonadaceae bacterium]|jgi:GPH family glycoside/pentoside/hexuronide:cation symporter|nr:MFS transporter [Dysgonamonadaceae bacterium]
MNTKTSEAKGFYKLSWTERIAFGSGDMAQNFIYQTVTTYLLFFYTNVYGLNPAIAAAMFLGVRIIDAIWDPIVGTLIDMNTTRFGKYRGWLLIMALPLTILMIACFIVPDFGSTGKVIYACVTYVTLSVVYTTVNVPFGALNAALTRDQHEITILTTTRMWLVNVAQVAITYGVPTLIIIFAGKEDVMGSPESRSAWLTTIVIYGVIGLAALLFSFAGTKERVVISKEDQAKVKFSDLFTEVVRNRPLRIISFMFITAFAIMAISNSAGTYFVKYNLGNEGLMGAYMVISALPALVILPFMPWMRKKLGKKGLLYLSLAISFIGFAGLFIIPADNITLIFISQFVRSVGFGVVGAFIWSLIPEAITYGEWQTGKRISGIANALIGFFFKFGLALGGFVPGIVLSLTGFNADIESQGDSALFGIKLLLAALPALLVVLLAFIVYRYDLTDEQLVSYGKEIENKSKQEQL